MPFRNFIVEIIKNLAWPTVIVIVACLFKKPISALIGRIKAMEYGNGKLHFESLPADVLERNAEARPDDVQPPSFDRLAPEARKVLKTLWKFQLELFPDYKNRFGFKVDPASEEFRFFNKGRNELTQYGLVATDYRLFCGLTEGGIKFCKENTAQIEKEANYYDRFGPG